MDAAFTGLLTTALPGNAVRVARAMADSLSAELGEAASAELVALLWSAMDNFADFPVGRDLLERRAAIDNELVHRWVRLARGWPTASDVADLGLSAMYGAVQVGEISSGFTAITMIRDALTQGRGDVADVELKLEGLYESLTAVGIPKAQPPKYRVGDAWTQTLNWRRFYDYSPKAKGSLILLIVGTLRANFGIAIDGIEDADLRNLLLAHGEAYREVDAVATLNAWQLPAEAHQQMVDWLVVAKAERRASIG